MRQADIAIIGGGLAGSSAAAVLGRAGISTILIDPHKVYPPDFRCEKIGGSQLRVLHKLGLYDAIRKSSAQDGYAWTARLGRMLETSRATSTACFTTISSTPCAAAFRPVSNLSKAKLHRL